MAGKEAAVIYDWILDYFCYVGWKEMKKSQKLEKSTIEFMSGLLSVEWENENERRDKKLFLLVLARIADGDNIEIRYDDGELSPLEDLLPHFYNLVNYQLDDDVIKEGMMFYDIIKMEIVLVFLRNKEYQKAEECFNRYFKDKITLSTNAVKYVKNMVKGKKKVQVGTQYSSFVNSIINYLQAIVDGFNEPLLIKAAENYLQPTEQSPTRKNKRPGSTSSDSDVKKRKTNDDQNTNNTCEYQQKLLVNWNKNVKDMFNNSNTEKEDATQDQTVTSPRGHSTPCKSKQSSTKSSYEPRPGCSKDSPYDRPPIRIHSIDTPSPKKTPKKTSSSETPKKTSSSETPKRTSSTVTPQKSPSSVTPKKSSDSTSKKPVLSPTRDKSPYFTRPALDRVNNLNGHNDSTNVSVLGGSRKRKWTNDEMEEFFDAVKVVGIGNWADIKEYLGTERTNVMLKDKWRTMLKVGDVDKLEAIYQKKREKKKAKVS
ncbi:Telomeric repeat-binding factor 1 [Mactra antiquata]